MDENAYGRLVSKCSCENGDSLTSETKEQKRRSFSLGFFNLRKTQSLNLQGSSKKPKRTNWIMKLNCTKNGEGDTDNHEVTSSDCHCTCYKQGNESDLNIGACALDVVDVFESNTIEYFSIEPVDPQQSVQNEVPVVSVQDVGAETALPEVVFAEAALPEVTLPEAAPSEAALPEVGLPEAGLPEAGLPEAALPEIVLPEAALPEVALSEAELSEPPLLEAALPEAIAVTSEVATVTSEAPVEVTAAESEPAVVAPAVVAPAEAVEVVVVEEPIVAALNEPNEANGGNGIYNRGVYSNSSGNIVLSAPFFDANWLRSFHEDCDEAARLQRAREIEQGVEAPPNFKPMRRVQLLYSDVDSDSGQVPRRLQLVCSSDLTVDSLCAFFQNRITLKSCPIDLVTGCHTQIDFIHCLVPDLLNITNCSFYWGKMNRYEAERLLEGKPEGTFLLRDSAQEEFLFSVSFRKYNRSLHARIEQWNHKFSFDSHDPGVYTSDTVCGLIEHYKDPSSCMFFEPMLTWPLHRNFTFSLQHICRAAIVSRLSYDDINTLQLPKSLKAYLKEYHYRQKVRVERFEDDVQWIDLRSVPP